MKLHAISAAVLAVLTTGACAQAPAPEPTAEGSLWRHFFGEGLAQGAGIQVHGLLQVGASANDKSSHDQASGGSSNLPVVGPNDEGLQFNQVALVVERQIKSNILPRVTPTPGPVPQDYDWGFRAELSYGRDGLPALTHGWDLEWGLNRTQTGVSPGANRQNYLAMPQVYAQFYMPWWQGMAFTLGRMGAGVGYEIPPDFRPSPNFFYSRTYAFVAQPDQVYGGLLSANVMRGEAGFLAAELGVVVGRQNLEDNNDSKSLIGALRWRSADMATWVNYSFMRGNEQNAPGHTVQMPHARIISPRDQRREHHSLAAVFHPAPALETSAEVLWGRQKGDGQADTVDVLSGPGFSGDQWSGLNAQALYRTRPDMQYGLRLEHFRNGKGIALTPVTLVGGNFNAVTVGLKYDYSKAVVFRPEIRHDWQSKNNGVNAFGGGTASRQTTVSADVVFYF